MKPKMTLDQHLETADDLAIVMHHLEKVFNRCQAHNYKSSHLMKSLRKVTPGFLNTPFILVKSELDNQFHELITNEQFIEFGHIYYNLQDRYKKISESSKEDVTH